MLYEVITRTLQPGCRRFDGGGGNEIGFPWHQCQCGGRLLSRSYLCAGGESRIGPAGLERVRCGIACGNR